MPQRKSGVDELRKNRKRHLHNLDIKTDLKKTIKNFLASVNSKKKDEALSSLNSVYKKLDKATKRHIISKNTASRRKSRFARLIAQLN
ncbi:MAG TPA: 30S ribosomal protein S20 [Candidatus Omnitrophota bacterium]|nr:30S ribosomal protein S20 [Candidatus Omnitrophota bacterium]